MGKSKLQKKLVLVYSSMISILVLGMSLLYFLNFSQERISRLEDNLVDHGDRMSSQIDMLFSTMNFITIDLISDWDFIPALATLAYYDRDAANNKTAILEARHTVEKSIYKYSLMRDFHRVAVYTPRGDFFTNNFGPEQNIEYIRTWVSEDPNLKLCTSKRGKVLILPPYLDHWNRHTQEPVFGIVRAIVGQQKGELLGYIEIQKVFTIIDEVFSIPADQGISIRVRTSEGFELFSIGESRTHKKDFTYTAHAPESGVVVSLCLSRKESLDSLYTFIALFAAVVFGLLLTTILFIRFVTIKLTRPLVQLTNHINSINLCNLPNSVSLESEQDEIASLNFAFNHLQSRLNEAIQKEILSQSLKIQANLDALQAQVNPHFLFNVLNVISSLGIEAGDRRICTICDHISSMLRYSTSTQQRDSTIREEIEHVQNYLSLQKIRYEHKLDYTIDIPNAASALTIPKITFQPFVENCIEHGFQSAGKTLKITILGRMESGTFTIQIIDNGPGIPENELERLRKAIGRIHRKVYYEKEIVELNIGGLGILNTYLRLALYFSDNFSFSIENGEPRGVIVKISRQGNDGI
jgi:two-component system, sensor histidine kinase YesM